MSERLVDKYETRGASLVHQLVLLEEERRPLPEDPSPAMLVTRVMERLIQASCAIEWELEECDDGLLQVAVHFIGAAGFALTAIAHLHGDPDELTGFKDRLIEQLDQEVVDTLEASQEFFATVSPHKLLHNCLALTVGACQCVAELEGVRSIPADEDDASLTIDDVLAEVEAGEAGHDEDDLLEQIADSLWQSAVAAAGAGQWLVELHESE